MDVLDNDCLTEGNEQLLLEIDEEWPQLRRHTRRMVHECGTFCRFFRKRYVLLSGAAIAFLIALSTTFILLYSQEAGKSSQPEICFRPECIEAAGVLVRSMNMNVNPCHDFYEFACGSWNKSNPSLVLDSSLDLWHVFAQRNQTIRNELIVSLDAPSPVSESDGAIAKMGLYYRSCVDARRTDGVGQAMNSLQNFVQKELLTSSWPRTQVFNSTSDDCFRMIHKGRRFGLTFGVFTNYVGMHPSDTLSNIVIFDAPKLTMGRERYVDRPSEAVRSAYRNYMLDAADLFRKGMPGLVSSAVPDTFLDELFAFETTLMNYTVEDLGKNNVMSLEEFAAYIPAISEAHWALYFSKAFELSGTDAEFTPKTLINVRQLSYYRTLGKLLQEKTSSSDGLKFLYNYFGWKAMETYVNHLGAGLQAIRISLRTAIDKEEILRRSTMCVNQIIEQFPKAAGSIYVRDHVDRRTKPGLESMVRFLLKSFKKSVEKVDWTDTRRKEALDKIDAMKAFVAYEDYLLTNDSRLNAEHKDFKVAGQYFDMYLSASKFVVQVESGKLARKAEKTDWIMGPLVMNSFQFDDFNAIVLPSAFYGKPVYDPGYPSYWNYGGAGRVIGHEIAHAFNSRKFLIISNDGSRSKNTRFAQKDSDVTVQRLVDQYNHYSYLGILLDGLKTLDENIADLVGLTHAFRAYKLHAEATFKDHEEPRLPGFQNFTPEQMFYLGYSQTRCGDFRASKAKTLMDNVHSPFPFRVIGLLRNSEEFSKAYQCLPKSYMNPTDKVGVL